MHLDLYDALEVSLDADADTVNKAYRKLSLRYHPDRANLAGSSKPSSEKFTEIKVAKDVLSDPDRRKAYDVFGVDLGEKPEQQVWTIGTTTVLQPLGALLCKTVLSRGALWLMGFRPVGGLILLADAASGVLFWRNATIRGVQCRSEEARPLFISMGVASAALVLRWLLPLVADAAWLLLQVADAVGIEVAVGAEYRKVQIGCVVSSLFFAWLLQNWWLWIFGLLVVVCVCVLIAIMLITELMRAWVEEMVQQHGGKVRTHRQALRTERQRMRDEVAELRRKVEERDPAGR